MDSATPTRHFAFDHERRASMRPPRRPRGYSPISICCVRHLLVVAFLLLSASDARRVIAEHLHPSRRQVEIRVDDFSFSDGQDKKQQVLIEARDIQSSELTLWPSTDDFHVITWDVKDETDAILPVVENAVVEETGLVESLTVAVVHEKESEETLSHETDTIDVEADRAKKGEDVVTPMKFAESHTAVWWWSHNKTELTTQEQAVVLAVVVIMLLVIGLVVAGLWQLSWLSWRLYRERQILWKLFCEEDPIMLDQELREFPTDLLSLRIKQIACVRLRYLRVVQQANDLKQQLMAVEFCETEMALMNMPLHVTNRKEMTFAEILTTVEEIACRGEQVAVEMMQLLVPARWKTYVDEKMWLTAQDESLQSLHLENARVQQLAEQISELLVAKRVRRIRTMLER
uniref:Uncharacterized protein n=1 Tax=Hyaloperonospora arabidopsidis (strain Emoy2) TaxID=559515 RepID=M4C478_HYAAE